ncbi:MAG TPA: MraY family glycosyltransferase, partial [Ktedonobacteraceae bacterium]|nr:MraY family glycosyltransferase [Ktedonobacteraceae bacterium]
LGLFLVAGVAFLLTYLFTFGVIALARKAGWVEKPVLGKIHTTSTPRIGGVGIYAAFVIASLLLYAPFVSTQKELVIYILFLVASTLIVVVHAYDDIRGLKPLPKIIAQTLAVLILIGPGLHYFHGVLFFGIHNPFPHTATAFDPALPWYKEPELTLIIRAPIVSLLAIPAVLFTWFWMVGMMNAVNFMDGIDGLASGLVTIAGLFITIISWMLHQYSIAMLAAIFTGAVAGFLPHNWNPARVWMGDSGSQFLGIGLAVLAVIGGAKFALLLLVLGIPILDIAWVAFNRIRRGQNPMERDELPLQARKTHLHYRLLFGGLSVRQICLVIYGATILLGACALCLPSMYKFLGIILVVMLMAFLLWWSTRLQIKREERLKSEAPAELERVAGR